MSPFWVSAFLDNATEHHQQSVEFWQAVTGYSVSAPRGDYDEFATLVPPDGDAFLRVQRRHQGEDRIHLDLHVSDPLAAADAARLAGATIVADRGYIVMASPGGLVFCFVTHPASQPPPAVTHAAGSTSRVAQVAIDVPAAAFDRELAFWAAVTGWQSRVSPISDDFHVLRQSQGQPLRLLLQRLGPDDANGVRAHLDWATSDRAAETQRHQALGARALAEHSHWTVLADPVGRIYCLTDSDPS